MMKSQFLQILGTALFVVLLLLTVILNALAGVGTSPFQAPTANVSFTYNTCITPAGFTFSIWGLIYTCLLLIAIYAITLLLRTIDGDKVWMIGGALTPPVLLVLSMNLVLNIAWLFVWDNKDLVASAILLILIAVTNWIAILFALYGFMKTSISLYQKSRIDAWLHVFVINGLGLYVMWTTLASLLNVSIMAIHTLEADSNTVCIVVLSILLPFFIVWVILENTVMKTFINPLISHNFVYMFAFVGIYVKNKDSASDAVFGLIITNLSLACVIFAIRINNLAHRNFKGCINFNTSTVAPAPEDTQEDK